ncbi:HotDog domain-containing protein [Daldinia caldariorum]|uniref:HotDog domain-containing protein n=1 Tax=Daldinia caldariorum TaxID=326644 RepID=UPI00200767AA|nr:HotDog domain-containing protein [Daldinia caldariorum]KAI1465551.1 HotDog domain-containing protein [Daldinia caldariorum]
MQLGKSRNHQSRQTDKHEQMLRLFTRSIHTIKMSSSNTPPIGISSSASLQVSAADLASAISADAQDAFPAVFATSRLVALMEIASARVLQPYLKSSELSVGVTIDVSHTAPTPQNAPVTAKATYTGKEGKLFVFDVIATDDGGEVGTAVHKRAIVDAQRLVAKAGKRITEKHLEGL